MPKLKVPPYNKKKTFSLKWAQKKMKEFGCVPVSEEDLKRDPELKKAFGFPKT